MEYIINNKTYKVDPNGIIKNGDWIISIIHEGANNEVKHVCKMVDINYNEEEKTWLGMEEDGSEFTCGFHKEYKIININDKNKKS